MVVEVVKADARLPCLSLRPTFASFNRMAMVTFSFSALSTLKLHITDYIFPHTRLGLPKKKSRYGGTSSSQWLCPLLAVSGLSSSRSSAIFYDKSCFQ